MLANLLNLITQMNARLGDVVTTYAGWSYLIIFVMILLEPLPLLTPFLPSGSLVLAAGALAADGGLNFWLVLALSVTAALLGDSGNYLLGRGLGLLALRRRGGKDREHRNLERAREFYRRYGAITLLVGRLLPFVRVIVPTLAGMGVMSYRRFFLLNGLGCVLWTSVFLLAGYYFGRIPIVRDNLLLGMLVAGVVVTLYMIIHRLVTSRPRRAAPEAPATKD